MDMADTAVTKSSFQAITNTINNSDIDLESTYESIYLSADTIFDLGDIDLLTRTYVSGIDSGYSRTYYRSLDMPDVPEGNYYLLLLSDVTNKYNEDNEENNLAYKSLYIERNLLDLTIESPLSISEINSGDTLLIPFTVFKAGDQDMGGFYVTAALSTDLEYSSSFDYVGPGSEDYYIMDTVNQIQDTLVFIVPELGQGLKNLLLIADAYSNVGEANENNNQHVIRLKINGFVGSKAPTIISKSGFCQEGEVVIVAAGAKEEKGQRYTWFTNNKTIIEGEKNDTLKMYLSQPAFLYVAIDSAGVYGEKLLIYIDDYFPDTVVTREGNKLSVPEQRFASNIQWTKDAEDISTNYKVDAANYGTGYYSVTIENEYCEATNDYGYIEITTINNPSNSFSVSVYPNPTGSLLHVSLGKDLPQGFWIELYDQAGSKIKQVRINQGLQEEPAILDISRLPQGSYILKIMDKNNFIESKIVIKY